MQFHVSLHPRPAAVERAVAVHIGELQVQPLAASDAIRSGCLAVTFDQALETLRDWPGMFIEPDGSFVWRPECGGQVDGQLVDGGPSLVTVELRGECSVADLQELRAACCGIENAIAFQLLGSGLFLDETEFCKLLSL